MCNYTKRNFSLLFFSFFLFFISVCVGTLHPLREFCCNLHAIPHSHIGPVSGGKRWGRGGGAGKGGAGGEH